MYTFFIQGFLPFIKKASDLRIGRFSIEGINIYSVMITKYFELDQKSSTFKISILSTF